MADQPKRSLRMEIKAISEEGTFEGLLSVYNNVDDGSDLVEPGAFTKTIQEHGSEIPLLWQHKADEPIGTLTLSDGPNALTVKGKLLMDLPAAQKAYKLIKARIVKGLSIGFKSVKDSVDAGIRRLKEVRLYEGSIVTFPMNEMALITSVKQAKEDGTSDFNEELTEIQLCNAFYQMLAALRNALQEAIASDADATEKASLSATIIEQFAAAYAAYLPAYLALLEENESNPWGYMSRSRMETKEGRTLSAATCKQIKSCHEKMMEGHSMIAEAGEMLTALMNYEAGPVEATLDSGAASGEKSEPISDHSAISQLLDQAKETYKWTN